MNPDSFCKFELESVCCFIVLVLVLKGALVDCAIFYVLFIILVFKEAQSDCFSNFLRFWYSYGNHLLCYHVRIQMA